MTTFKEGPRTAEYLISEANGHLSRETGVLAAGIVGELPAGSVLGKVTVGGAYKLYDPAANDGSQNVARILFEAGGTGDVRTMTARASEVKASKLTWFPGATANQKAAGVAALAALNIIVR